MQRATLFAAIFSLSTCASMPEKPVVPMGVLDVPAGIVREGLTGEDDISHKPILDYDRASCFKPPAWEKVTVYISLLEIYAKELETKLQRCRR